MATTKAFHMATTKALTVDILTRAVMHTIADDLAPEALERVTGAVHTVLSGALTPADLAEVNPENPALIQMREHWHTLCALVFLKLGLSSIELTSADLQAVDGRRALVLHAHQHSLELKLLTEAEAEALRAQVEAKGGLAL